MKYICVLTLLAVLVGCKQKVPPPDYKEELEVVKDCNIEDSVHGIDVSYHNGVIDWEELNSNHPEIDFVYIRATVGLNKDSKYQDYL